MSLPTKDNILTMDYAFNGQPFVYVPAKDTIYLTTMDYAFNGQPFVVYYASGASTDLNISVHDCSDIKTVLK